MKNVVIIALGCIAVIAISLIVFGSDSEQHDSATKTGTTQGASHTQQTTQSDLSVTNTGLERAPLRISNTTAPSQLNVSESGTTVTGSARFNTLQSSRSTGATSNGSLKNSGTSTQQTLNPLNNPDTTIRTQSLIQSTSTSDAQILQVAP